MEEWLLCFPSWADIIKSGDNHCLLLLLDCVSALGLFLRFCKWGAVYCLGCNRVHPVSCFFLVSFFFFPCIVNCSFLLCGQPVQFIDSVDAVFSKVNMGRNTDNGSKYLRLVWWHLVDVFLFSSNLRTDNCPVFCATLGDSSRKSARSMWTHGIIPRCTGNRVMGFFPDSINMTWVFKRQRISLRLDVHLISAAWPSRLRPGCLTSSPPASLWEASGRCTFPKALHRLTVRLDILQRRSLKVCVTCSRWMLWHLKEMPARNKVSTSRLSESARSCGLRNFSGFVFLHSAADTRWRNVHFPKQLFGAPLASSCAGVSLVGARSPSETLLFDLTGTGLPTESRDYTVSVEHKQTVG